MECPTCGVDVTTGGGKNINCPDCGGKGYITDWLRSSVKCRKVSMEPGEFNVFAGGVVTGPMMGNYLLQGEVADLRIMQTIRDTEGAYILVDGERLKPTSVSMNGITGDVILEVRTKLVGTEDDR
ncbi:MAG: hypothetical protein WC822_06075 [Candidatus Paceibacterota bacterium]